MLSFLSFDAADQRKNHENYCLNMQFILVRREETFHRYRSCHNRLEKPSFLSQERSRPLNLNSLSSDPLKSSITHASILKIVKISLSEFFIGQRTQKSVEVGVYGRCSLSYGEGPLYSRAANISRVTSI